MIMKTRSLLGLVMLLALSVTTMQAQFVKTDSTLLIPQLTADIVVDGDIDAVWNSIPWESMHNKLIDSSTGADDYDVKFKMAWKGTMVYVLADINDDILVADETFAGHLRDYFNLYFDFAPANDTGDYSDLSTFYISTSLDETNQLFGGRYDGNWSAPTDGWQMVVKNKTGGYIVESYVDASYFEQASLSVGQVFGFNVESGDNDDITTAVRQSHWLWSTSSTGKEWSNTIGEVGMVTLGDALTSTKEVRSAFASVYPNPASGTLYVSNTEGVSRIKIRNVTGQVLVDVAATEKSINIGHLKTGVYMVSLEGAKNSTQKIVVK
jgi:hypothetical protein